MLVSNEMAIMQKQIDRSRLGTTELEQILESGTFSLSYTSRQIACLVKTTTAIVHAKHSSAQAYDHNFHLRRSPNMYTYKNSCYRVTTKRGAKWVAG